MRSVPEWIGKHDDQAVPPRVRQRIFDRHEGICYLSGRAIRPGDRWELEHIIALVNGGEHRESNLAPALKEPHKSKTKQDRKLGKKIARVRKRHIGIRKQSRFPCSRNSPFKKKINGQIVLR